MSNAAIDRRILRAFYTQYVSVLLIVLVFGIWTFQLSAVRPSVAAPQVASVASSSPPVGLLRIEDPFEVGATVALRSSIELEAIAETLRNHDLRATFRFKNALQDTQTEIVATTMLLRLEALRAFFQAQGVPADAVTVALGSEFGDGAKTEVSFEFVGRARELR
jgi:hypothetical protein